MIQSINYDNGYYEGEIKDGKPYGFGTYRWNNGDVYTGEYVKGIRHGKGKFVYANGNYYDGDWVDGKYHGHGIYHWNDGDQFEGEWQNDKRHGSGKWTYANGNYYTGVWEHGESVSSSAIIHPSEEKSTTDKSRVQYAHSDDEGDVVDGNPHGISRAEESANDDFDETEDTADYSSADDCYYAAPQLTKKQIAARKRLRKGTAHEVSHTKSTDVSSPPRAKANSNTYRDPIPVLKQSKASNKPGKGKLFGKIILKTICCIFGLAIIALAVVQFVTTKGQVSEEERVGALIGQLFSGGFACGIWLFYYGTIVALKKAGIQVRDDLKDPSFWEVVSVTTVTTHYSDGSKEEKKYSNIKGSFFGEILVFLAIFTIIQTYYFVAAPVLGLVSLFRDIKDLKE